MLALLKREISSFFSSIIGALVISVFLLITGLFLWVLPGDLNIIFGGYASLESLFYLAPWVYLFLVPAVTMRLFADERKMGTLDLLLTRPISEMQIVLSKYLAGLILVAISLLPTLLYVFSVVRLGNPVGNLDMGGTWGSYIGLFFLAAVYVAIGTFSSSLSDNQIVAFVIAVVLCFTFYTGFDSLAALPGLKSMSETIRMIGIDSHYSSVSRGVLDSRDIIYFLSLIFFFVFLTKFVLSNQKK
ncbi:gliding motility-associated ABC transporter permease subunit GldF [Carboxylicivirga sp. N1Y90]|uniref:gliding motility-associated ABC transporter permease subunit GldF n=1 Tax=Carboxylicivirga fragile TaxID=3417571 RepID=UPI003D34EC3B|nr:gliding motility-associated ABC transporter permease subunit GldF [Marinilabiliaceae bacterium N1Y90]